MNDIIQRITIFLSNKENNQAHVDEVLTLLEDEFIDLRLLNKVVQLQDNIQINNNIITLKLSSEKKEHVSFSSSHREELVKELENRLIGPSEGDEETLKVAPSSYYLTGRLFPYGSSSNVIHEDETGQPLNEIEGVTLEGEAIEEIITTQDKFRNSSLGISIIVKELREINCCVSWAMYEQIEIPHEKDHEKVHIHYKRSPQKTNVSINLKSNGELILNKDYPLCIKWYVRRGKSGYDVSIYLVHTLSLEDTQRFPRQSEIIFQPKLAFEIEKENIIPRSTPSTDHLINFLYRHRTVPIIGHQISVDWTETTELFSFETSWLPKEEVPIVEHKNLEAISYNMLDLASNNKKEVIQQLYRLPNEYINWIDEQANLKATLNQKEQEILLTQLEKAHHTSERIREGIQLLEENNNAWIAFRLANLAMHVQREQGINASAHRENNNHTFEPQKSSWRLFQLAFLLMNLPSTFNKTHKDRKTVDLLWFPTGGGKTEAYLGLAAFILFARRLTNDVDNPMSYGGMSVMMRYTLRLLTIQQFQRATLLICAMEAIRRNKDVYSSTISELSTIQLGEVPFSIGLWIGSSSTPNNYAQAKVALEKLSNNETLENEDFGNPMQLSHCPWCGTKLEVKDYFASSSKSTIKCSLNRCEFSTGIPAHTIDDAIYDHLPSLVIGTVDKLAQITWQPRIGELFGRKTSYNRKLNKFIDETPDNQIRREDAWLPPADLIIQDELHLLNGPLGSLTGLYEFVIEEMMGFGLTKPKIIASTATISGADAQIRALYDRTANQFPVYVQSPDDSFFSKTVPITQKAGRLYVGISSPGVSMKIHTVNVYGALIAATRIQPITPSLDPYWTIVGYFNTIRELAGTNTMFYDEIRTYLQSNNVTEPLLDFEELTSRKKAQEIPLLLSRMEQPIGSSDTLDAVLCTNMISVGVDVNRLGLMVVHGQPKTTAEYIQATSRVGRQHPGLVVTLLNPQRTRDMFHFEQFKSFHQSFYQYVEPTSVTPFSSGSLKRGITGVLVGILRQATTVPPLSKANNAGLFDINGVDLEMINRLVARAHSVYQLPEDEIRQLISDVLDKWQELVDRTNKNLAYRRKVINGRETNFSHHLLTTFESTPHTKDSMNALTSLRSVEPEIKVEEEMNPYDSW